jgi:dipeptidyl aminopeptidase/acylaminoacyl peptidase
MPDSHRGMPRFVRPIVVVALGLVFAPGAWSSGYQSPPDPLPAIVDAPRTPRVRLSPDREWMLLLESPSLLSLADLSEPELRLAGRRISPRNNGPTRVVPIRKMTLRRVSDLSERTISGLPQGAAVGGVSWSPDGQKIAFALTRGEAIELWVADVARASARRLGDAKLNLAAGETPRWFSDSQTIAFAAVPVDRGAAPETPRLPGEPVIQESRGKKAPARTYQDLLKNAHDGALFEYYFTAQLQTITLDGQSRSIGDPRIVWGFDPSPDGKLVLVESLHRPFSFLVPAYRFPRLIEVVDRDGKPVHQVADLPLQEEIPIAFGSVPTGPRSVGWRADAPATLSWVEALDGGDARAEADERDRVFTLAAPFEGEPVALATLGLRYAGVEWGSDDLALVHESWWKTRQTRTWIVAPGRPSAKAELLVDRSYEDRYSDPGDAVTIPTAQGRDVLLTADKGKSIFLIGSGASKEGDRPFLDRLELSTKKTERLFRSEAPYYERPITFTDRDGKTMLTRRESKEQPPNYFARTVGDGQLRQLTDFPHPTPELAGLQKEQIRYERADGVKLTATLYLPPGYEKEQGPLPVVVWAYPQEFKSADAAGQVTDSPYRFSRVGWSSPLMFLTLGYAVIDDPSMPIIGEGEDEPNDTYVDQLVSSAKAAVDEVARRGVGDPERCAIGGHSYGAFMTANLLAHSDLFRAGIARSGAYNRTLTPFGFQAEERTFWQAPEVYFAMSPFMHAEKIDEPILLIHGDSDNNSGTFPMQSERMYGALKGHGATVRLVVLPNESHGYRARESVMHMLWEMAAWLDEYVKNAPAR